MNNGRNSNIELFRIILMIFIISGHYVVQSDISHEVFDNPFIPKNVFLLFMSSWGKMAINCFLLITGYFMCEMKYNLKKFFMLVGEVMFYKILTVLIVCICVGGVTTTDFIKNIIPIRDISNNYVDCFPLFYLFIPFINTLVSNLKKMEHRYLLLILYIVYVVFGTVPLFSVQYNYLSWFLTIYLTGAYIKKYYIFQCNSCRWWTYCSIFIIILSFFSVLVFSELRKPLDCEIPYYLLRDSNKILAVCTSISLFMMVICNTIKCNKFINTISKYTFGVLLFHSSNILIANAVWNRFLKVSKYYNSDMWIAHFVGSILLVYVTGIYVDMMRKKTIEKWYIRIVDIIYERITLRVK